GRAYRTVREDFKPSPGIHSIQVELDTRVAEHMLDVLTRSEAPDSEYSRLADEPVIKQLLMHRGPTRLLKPALIEYWRRAADPNPLNRLYEWVFPGSYYDYGGVAVQAEDYRRPLGQLRTARGDITSRVRGPCSRLMPADL